MRNYFLYSSNGFQSIWAVRHKVIDGIVQDSYSSEQIIADLRSSNKAISLNFRSSIQFGTDVNLNVTFTHHPKKNDASTVSFTSYIDNAGGEILLPRLGVIEFVAQAYLGNGTLVATGTINTEELQAGATIDLQFLLSTNDNYVIILPRQFENVSSSYMMKIWPEFSNNNVPESYDYDDIFYHTNSELITVSNFSGNTTKLGFAEMPRTLFITVYEKNSGLAVQKKYAAVSNFKLDSTKNGKKYYSFPLKGIDCSDPMVILGCLLGLDCPCENYQMPKMVMIKLSQDNPLSQVLTPGMTAEILKFDMRFDNAAYARQLTFITNRGAINNGCLFALYDEQGNKLSEYSEAEENGTIAFEIPAMQFEKQLARTISVRMTVPNGISPLNDQVYIVFRADLSRFFSAFNAEEITGIPDINPMVSNDMSLRSNMIFMANPSMDASSFTFEIATATGAEVVLSGIAVEINSILGFIETPQISKVEINGNPVSFTGSPRLGEVISLTTPYVFNNKLNIKVSYTAVLDHNVSNYLLTLRASRLYWGYQTYPQLFGPEYIMPTSWVSISGK